MLYLLIYFVLSYPIFIARTWYLWKKVTGDFDQGANWVLGGIIKLVKEKLSRTSIAVMGAIVFIAIPVLFPLLIIIPIIEYLTKTKNDGDSNN